MGLVSHREDDLERAEEARRNLPAVDCNLPLEGAIARIVGERRPAIKTLKPSYEVPLSILRAIARATPEQRIEASKKLRKLFQALVKRKKKRRRR